MIFHVFICILHLLLVYYKLTKWPAAPRWFDSSVGRALHRYRRGHGFESRSGLNFFQALISHFNSFKFLKKNISKPESGQRNMDWLHSWRREEAFAQTSSTKRFSTAISALVKTWPTKAGNSATLWPCSTTKGSWTNKLPELVRLVIYTKPQDMGGKRKGAVL